MRGVARRAEPCLTSAGGAGPAPGLLVLAREAVLDGVGAARQLDPHRIRCAFARVVLDEAPAQPSRLDAHQCIGLRVEIGGAPEHLDADRIALQALAGAGQRLLDDEAQEIRRSFGLLKTTARKDALERGVYFARARFAKRVDEIASHGVIAALSTIGHPSAPPAPFFSHRRRAHPKQFFFSLYELFPRA